MLQQPSLMIEPSTYEDLLKTSPTCRAMDPLSMTASIITVHELTTTLTGFITGTGADDREDRGCRRQGTYVSELFCWPAGSVHCTSKE